MHARLYRHPGAASVPMPKMATTIAAANLDTETWMRRGHQADAVAAANITVLTSISCRDHAENMCEDLDYTGEGEYIQHKKVQYHMCKEEWRWEASNWSCGT